ncbi:MAG: ribose-5-phosphate isomerase RpiA, partial [Planctomycetota bacterium]
LDIVGVPTSVDTEIKARAFGIPLATLSEVESIDLTIDGADEIDARFDMIKGGGGALLREKVVAALSKREVIVVDRSKVVERLGLRFLLPVEVVPFARATVARKIAQLGATWTLRMREAREVYLTDNGNEILDCKFPGGIADAPALERALDEIPGVVESGLFIGLAHALVLGDEEGRSEVRERAG